jgi:hypothetical protein
LILFGFINDIYIVVQCANRALCRWQHTSATAETSSTESVSNDNERKTVEAIDSSCRDGLVGSHDVRQSSDREHVLRQRMGSRVTKSASISPMQFDYIAIRSDSPGLHQRLACSRREASAWHCAGNCQQQWPEN